MKHVFISAYACAPSGQSELSVGWNLVKNLAQSTDQYKFIVVTQKNDVRIHVEEDIQNFISTQGMPENIEFYFFDAPFPWLRNFMGGFYIYYLLWQKMLIGKFKELDKIYNFDIVHHLTFVSVNRPSYLYKCGKSFIWGPLGGAEIIPFPLYKGIKPVNKIFEVLRSAAIKLNRWSPNFLKCAKKSDKIIVVNRETLNMFKKKYSYKTIVIPAIGYDKPTFVNREPFVGESTGKIKLITVGLLYYRKGIDISINVLEKLLNNRIEACLTIIGDGNTREHYENLVREKGLSEKVVFKGAIPRTDVLKEIQDSHIFLFPSRRDSGGFVVIEAIQNNVPVISFDLGGPAHIISLDSSFGRLVNPCQRMESIIEDFCQAIREMDIQGSKEAIREKKNLLDDAFAWESKAEKILNIYDAIVKKGRE